nr:hypothetical protein [Candidatus Freyarchaeota archaeon]
MTLGGSVVLVGLGVILVVGGFDVLYFLDVFSIGLLSVYSLLIFGIGSFLAPLMLGIGLVSIVVGVAALKYLTGEAVYSFS